MPNFSVSCSQEQFKKLEARAISPSKAFQLGIDMAASGGVDSFGKVENENKSLRSSLETVRASWEHEKERNERLKKMLNEIRLGKADKKTDLKKIEKEADELLSEVTKPVKKRRGEKYGK